MVGAGFSRLCVSTLAVCVALGASPGLGVPIVLKQSSGAGCTFASTADTGLLGFAAGEKQFNSGGMGVFDYMYGATRPLLVQFDLNAIPDKNLVAGVTSATLRLYRTDYGFQTYNYKVAQLAQDWVEGTSTRIDAYGVCDGAQWFNRNAGIVVSKSALGNYGGGIYYIDGVADLGDDPVNAGKKHVRPANDNTGLYNNQNVYTQAASLTDLQALATTTRGYYWDSGASRLYLNKNDINVRWYKSTDHWTTAGGTVTGSYINDTTSPGKPPAKPNQATWIEFNVTSIVSNWLVSGQDNYGFQMLEIGNGGGKFAMSEHATETLRPELVLDLVMAVPPSAVTDLATSDTTSGSITLTWMAPGAHGSVGTAAAYDIRYSTSTITEANWTSATQVTGEPIPAAVGTSQSTTVLGLSANTTYYFAMKTADEASHWSALSNVPSAMTLEPDGPAAVTNLAASSPTGTSITLTWTAPSESGSIGTPASYDLRYSTSTITEANWADATPVTGEPVPAAAGTNQGMTVSGLASDTTYYFALKTSDEVPNISALSNVASAATLDIAAPAAVANLAASTSTITSITLTWTAPGDDGATGTATSYDMRYSTATITEANWASATPVTGEPAPAAAGTNQSMAVSGLSSGTTYYFALKTSDEAPNISGLSNVTSGTTQAADTTAPAAITDLATSTPISSSITLTWTAPGDDAGAGTASSYDVRYSTSTITEANWASATPVTNEPAPAAAGTSQSMTVSGLSVGTTYYFAIKTADEVPNTSALSNVASGTPQLSADTTAPAAITGFQVLTGQREGASSLDLAWHPTGDDGTVGKANHYELRYSTSSINDGNWASATPYTYNLPIPQAYSTSVWEGNNGSTYFRVGGLQPSTLYYFGLKAVDEANNASPLVTCSCTTGHDHDVIGPSMAQDLAVSNYTNNSVTLTWKASGDDWIFLTATSYDVRYITEADAAPSTTMTNDLWFWKATRVPCTLTPQAYGSPETFTVTGLNANTKYYFGVRAVDEQMNWSSMALVSATTSTASDSTAPAAISDLVVSHPSSRTVRLTWTAPGDDGSSGTATTYDIRYSNGPINEDSWASARQATGELAPKVAGTSQTWTVQGLSANMPYTFAIKAIDEAGNASALSNAVSSTTLTSSDLNKPVLTEQDFEYLGAFRLPTSPYGQSTGFALGGIAIRRVGGNLRMLATAGTWGPAVYECIPPTNPAWGSNTNYYSCPLATEVYDWGAAVQGSWVWSNAERAGLLFDPATSRFYYSWHSGYTTNTNYPSLAWTDLIPGAPVRHGTWMGDGTTVWTKKIQGGSTIIPDWFANAYLGGRKLGLGFGGYYSIAAGCSYGPFLAAAFHPTDGVPMLDTINLLDYPLGHQRTRNPDYYFTPTTGATAPNPVNGVGLWNWDDLVYGAGCWIDLPDKHGMVYMPTISSGHCKYWSAANSCARSDTYFNVYDPKDLAAVAQGTKLPREPEWQEWYAQIPNPNTPGGGGLVGQIQGMAFDAQSRILYAVAPQVYTMGGQEAFPVVHGWRIRETPRKVGDINNDGYVNVGDLQLLVAAWSSQKAPPSGNWNADADLNTDDFVNVGDLQLLVAHWGE